MILLFFITALCSTVSPSYIVYEERKTWFEAQAFCREHHFDLATITSSADMELLMKIARRLGFAWIGLFDDMTKWKWSEGNVDLITTFTRWESANPDYLPAASENRVCVKMLTNGYWDDTNCSSTISKVCTMARAGPVFFNSTNTWIESQDDCRRKYRDLPTVTNLNENTNIKDLITEESWIGLYRHTWTNWSDSTFSTFTMWNNQINRYLNTSASFHCAIVDTLTGMWFRCSCNEKIPFICNGQGSSSAGSTPSPGTSGTLKPGYTSRVKLRLKSEADLTNADVQKQILQQIEAKMLDQGLSQFKLRWTKVEKETPAEEEERETCTDIV